MALSWWPSYSQFYSSSNIISREELHVVRYRTQAIMLSSHAGRQACLLIARLLWQLSIWCKESTQVFRNVICSMLSLWPARSVIYMYTIFWYTKYCRFVSIGNKSCCKNTGSIIYYSCVTKDIFFCALGCEVYHAGQMVPKPHFGYKGLPCRLADTLHLQMAGFEPLLAARYTNQHA